MFNINKKTLLYWVDPILNFTADPTLTFHAQTYFYDLTPQPISHIHAWTEITAISYLSLQLPGQRNFLGPHIVIPQFCTFYNHHLYNKVHI